MPDIFRQLQNLMLRKDGGDREMVDILSLVLQRDEGAVLRAVELALEAGVPTKTHVLNLLHRLIYPSKQIIQRSTHQMLSPWKRHQKQIWIVMTT